jgi:hypothetical protein
MIPYCKATGVGLIPWVSRFLELHSSYLTFFSSNPKAGKLIVIPVSSRTRSSFPPSGSRKDHP